MRDYLINFKGTKMRTLARNGLISFFFFVSNFFFFLEGGVGVNFQITSKSNLPKDNLQKMFKNNGKKLIRPSLSFLCY